MPVTGTSVPQNDERVTQKFTKFHTGGAVLRARAGIQRTEVWTVGQSSVEAGVDHMIGARFDVVKASNIQVAQSLVGTTAPGRP